MVAHRFADRKFVGRLKMAFDDISDNGADEIRAEDEEVLHFYYNREERLKNAPQSVKDYYSGKFKLNKGFKVLVANKANRFVLIILIVCLVFVLFTTVLTSENTARIGNIDMQLSSFAFEDEIYVSLKINASDKKSGKKSEKKLTVPVEMNVVCYDADKQPSLLQKIEGVFTGDELFLRTKFSDYDILYVRADVAALGESRKLFASVQRK